MPKKRGTISDRAAVATMAPITSASLRANRSPAMVPLAPRRGLWCPIARSLDAPWRNMHQFDASTALALSILVGLSGRDMTTKDPRP